MPKVEAPAVERIIANTINETARGDPDALAARIVAALAEAGFRRRGQRERGHRPSPPACRDETALPEPKRGYLVPRPRSHNRLGLSEAPGERPVRRSGDRHGGIGFLSGPRNPEHEALLRLIGASILDPHGAEADGEVAAVNTRREWSGGELNELGEMLVRGLSIEEIARRLRRDHGEVQDKVVEIGRACRESSSAATMSEPAKVFEERKFPWRLSGSEIR